MLLTFIFAFSVSFAQNDTIEKYNKAIQISLDDGIITMENGAKYPESFRIQFASTGVNPSGGAGAAIVDDYGITSVLKYIDGVTRISAVNIRFPSSETYLSNVDTTKQLSVRIGYSSDTNTGYVRWGVEYVFIKNNKTCTSSDGEVFVDSDVSIIADGFVGAIFNLPAPDSDDVAVFIRITRYGGADTNTGNAYLFGISLVGTTIE